MAGRIEVRSDDGDYYVVTEKEAWEQAKIEDSPWGYEAFLERAVYITDKEDAEWKRLYVLKQEASAAYFNYVCKMGTMERPEDPESIAERAISERITGYVLREVDPELERILQEEEEIERDGNRTRGLPCMKHRQGSSCVKYGEHTTHLDQYGNQWTDTPNFGWKDVEK